MDVKPVSFEDAGGHIMDTVDFFLNSFGVNVLSKVASFLPRVTCHCLQELNDYVQRAFPFVAVICRGGGCENPDEWKEALASLDESRFPRKIEISGVLGVGDFLPEGTLYTTVEAVSCRPRLNNYSFDIYVRILNGEKLGRLLRCDALRQFSLFLKVLNLREIGHLIPDILSKRICIKSIECRLHSEPENALVDEFSKLLSLDRNISVLKLYQGVSDLVGQKVFASLVSNTTLTNLTLYDGVIESHKSASSLAEFLSRNSTLRYLSLGRNCLGKNFYVITNALTINKGLGYIDFSGNRLDDEQMEHLSHVLQKNTALRELNLVDNAITELGVEKLSQALKGNYHMQTIQLYFNPIYLSPIAYKVLDARMKM